LGIFFFPTELPGAHIRKSS